MFSGTSQTEKITKLEYHTKTFTECIEIESQINNISKYGHSSDIAYVRSLYWVHSNMLNKISPLINIKLIGSRNYLSSCYNYVVL